ncbi:Cof-type HAD-IIB family hydrolase [Singulisphaera sp. PoT]|uniref:Cof-type HAD-IIB family hydrolase n=1 Tax=Singulisphaera sp. PoT TaxID=3411797 RepID=UPI003BF559B8
MRRIRLVVIDLDGTLLGPDHRIPPVNARAIAACRAAGVQVMLASGRMITSVRPYCMELGLEGPQITLNGGAIVDVPDGEVEALARLPEDVVRSIAEGLKARGIPFVIMGQRTIYALPGTAESAILEGYGEPEAVVVTDLGREQVPDPVKLLAFAADPTWDDELTALSEGVAETVRTGGGFLEFMVPGISKGTALEEILRRHDIPRDSVLAIGDYYNDLSMFEVAGISVAMGDAPSPIREAADFVTASCIEGGLAQALHRHVLETNHDLPTEVLR